jgi:single-stranded-DNA-specific exonuclease
VGYGKVQEFNNLLKEKYGEDYLNILSNYNYSKEKLRIDITFYPYINHYNGVDSLQLRVSGFRLA